MEDKRRRGDRGRNKNKYHFRVYNEIEDTNEYFFTLQDICDKYNISRSTANNILMSKQTGKYDYLKIERSCKPVVQIELNISDEDMIKYLPQLL